MQMSTLPQPRQPRHILTSLISSLSATTNSAASNTFKDAPPSTQQALLTLHVLFPNELLPALDLLDRGLVTRFTLASPPGQQPQEHQRDDESPGDGRKRGETVFYAVRSAQQQVQSRYRSGMAEGSSHQVHLTSWSCSCPAFAFAAFPANSTTSPSPLNFARLDVQSRSAGGWTFGGLTWGEGLAVCKHLLACILIERGGEMFAGTAAEREVSVEELAGWAAGWGD